MMLFAIVFGLSMDYEVFLLQRIREEYDRTGDNATAVADGLAGTARVITAAALIMVFVFGSFVLVGPPRAQAHRARPRGRGRDRRDDRPHRPRARDDGAARRRELVAPRWMQRIVPRIRIEEAQADPETPPVREDELVGVGR